VDVPAHSCSVKAEGPRDHNTVSGTIAYWFAIDETEVTVAQFAECVQEGDCVVPDTGGTCNWGKPDRINHPVNCVDLQQAHAFCWWAGKRLPRNREWACAALGADGRAYPWGNEEPGDQLCWKRSRDEGSCEVGTHPLGKSPLGVFDMAGNVGEWTDDSYCPRPAIKCASGFHFVAGGSWTAGEARLVRSTRLTNFVDTKRRGDLGFRCAR
jgi:formylglycine-generating enzyme required for sulfatase activity